MRKAVTLRLDTDLLAAVRRYATMENRTLTNFIETAIKQRIAASAAGQTTTITSLAFADPPMQQVPTLPDQSPSASSENNHE